MITKKLYGTLPDGREIHIYTITNCWGEYVSLLDYGASIHQVVVRGRPDLADVVLGASPDTIAACSYRGGTIGRCANRIGFGRCRIRGKQYQLEQNQMGHFLHGGSGNYANKLFVGEMLQSENAVVFRYIDRGEAGFDGNVEAVFSFTFDERSRLSLKLSMTSDTPTVLNPTNHAYFNLGCSDARDHKVWVGTDTIVTRGASGLPDGGVRSALGTPADFTVGQSIREGMSSDTVGYFRPERKMYDEYYVFPDRKLRLVATASSEEAGREVAVYTDMPCLILFCAGGRKPEQGKNGQLYEGYCALCLETGFVPNAVNCPEYLSPVFNAGQTLTATTIYQFKSFP